MLGRFVFLLSLYIFLSFPAFAGNESRYISSGDADIVKKCGGDSSEPVIIEHMPDGCNAVMYKNSGIEFNGVLACNNFGFVGLNGGACFGNPAMDSTFGGGFVNSRFNCDGSSETVSCTICKVSGTDCITVSGSRSAPLLIPHCTIGGTPGNPQCAFCFADSATKNDTPVAPDDECQMRDPNPAPPPPASETCHFRCFADGASCEVAAGLSHNSWCIPAGDWTDGSYYCVIGNGGYRERLDFGSYPNNSYIDINPRFCSSDGSISPCYACNF